MKNFTNHQSKGRYSLNRELEWLKFLAAAAAAIAT